MYNLQVQAEAFHELQEAFQWYETQQEGLGWKFISAFEEGCGMLQHHPQHYTALNEHFRRYRLQSFPYLLVYEIEASTVIIIAVRHAAMRPL